jgi:hypothetical protein
MWSRAAGAALGVVAAFVVFELCLIPFASAEMPPAPDIEADSGAGAAVVSRQLDEGIATTRFSSGGSRLTGRAPIPEAPAIVLLGDSYVVAREVSDESTMGAVLERLAIADGRAVNVRQYGWRAAGPEQYLTVASQVLRRWRPERVVIVLNDDDLDGRESALYAPGWAPPVTTWRDHSRVITLARHRTLLLDTRLKASMDRWRRRLCCRPERSEGPAFPQAGPSLRSGRRGGLVF